MIQLIITTAITLVASFILTAQVRNLAFKYNFVDRPDGGRKMQKKAVALGGGVAIYLSVICGLLFLWATWYAWDWGPRSQLINRYQILLLLVASGLLCAVGMYDDRFHIRGRNKLFFQIIACSILVFHPDHGLSIQRISLLGNVPLGVFGPILTMGWLLVSINSFNLIDGVDGLAGTLGVIFGITFGIMAMMLGNTLDGIVAFVMVASILGFLRYNFNPATIYMGDAGSMLIGLILGTLALRSSMKGVAVTACSAPLAVWIIPILDSGMAILRRKLTGRSIYATDRGHIHHRLLTSGLSPRQTVGLIGGLCVISSIAALSSLYFQKEWIGFVGVAIVFGLLLISQLFGNVEMKLLQSKILGLGHSIVNLQSSNISRSRQSSHRLQGKLQWEEKIWHALVESAERFNLTKIRLNLYLPHLHEDFHASWKQKALKNSSQQPWKLEVPLTVDGMGIGSLYVMGVSDPRSASEQLNHFLDFLGPLETQIRDLLQQSTKVQEIQTVSTAPTITISPDDLQRSMSAIELPVPNKAI